MLFNILVLISLLAALLIIRRLLNVMPSLLACLIRWKENINMETSVKQSRNRDILMIILSLPICLIVYRFGLYQPAFMNEMNSNLQLAATIGAIGAFIGLRYALEAMIKPARRNIRSWKAGLKTFNTYFCILGIVLLGMGFIMSFTDTPKEIIKSAMLWVSAAIYLLLLVRKFQIFNLSCNFFTAFLYLCALELIPTGALVLSAVIF